ncbi:MAG: FxsA family protein [Leptospirillia bacterium]
MLIKLILLFTLLPLAELYLLIEVGQVIGGLNTVALVLLTGVGGAYLARMEGIRTLFRAQENLQAGIMPAEEMIDGLLIFAAGAVLITPGIITDCMGLLILFPPTRRYFKIWLRKQFDRAVSRNTIYIHRGPGDGFGPL